MVRVHHDCSCVTTHHGSSDLRGNVVGDLKSKVLVGTDMACIAAHGDNTIWVLGAVGVNHVGAVVLLVSLAVVASEVSSNLSADTDTVTD